MIKAPTVRLLAVLGTLALCGIVTAHAADDWKYFGDSNTQTYFYLANSVGTTADRTTLVWTEQLQTTLLFAQIHKAVIERTNKILHQGYIPPYVAVQPPVSPNDEHQKLARAKLLFGTILIEQIADEKSVRPTLRSYIELNCAATQFRFLSIVGTLNNKSVDINSPTEWFYIPPDSRASELASILCPPSNHS